MKHIELDTLVQRIFEVHENFEELQQYRYDGETWSIFVGWNGMMSPISRSAYIKEFGEELVVEAEKRADAKRKERIQWFESTQYFQHMKAANRNSEKGIKYVPKEGDYVWCVNSGLKGEGGFPLELKCLVEYYDEKKYKEPRLIYIDKVYHIFEDDLMDSHKADELVQNYDLKGGSVSDDVNIDSMVKWNTLDNWEKKTFYTVGVAVITPLGKWYVIDSEGYNYARYIYVTNKFQKLFKSEIKQINE